MAVLVVTVNVEREMLYTLLRSMNLLSDFRAYTCMLKCDVFYYNSDF